MEKAKRYKEIEVYRAFDGKEFDSERECLQYEEDCRVKIFDKNTEDYIMKQLDDELPLKCAEVSESNKYDWYMLKTDNDIKNFIDNLRESYHEGIYADISNNDNIICLERGYHDDGLYIHTFGESVVYTIDFFKNFGIDIDFTVKKHNKKHPYAATAEKIIARIIIDRLNREAYETYQQDWCTQRGKSFEDVISDENPKEKYVSYNEFCNNEALESSYMKDYLSKQDFKKWKYYIKKIDNM